ncbi:MAG: YicC/YloC family endoribonuclease [Granulosicoccus sp.]
MLQSMTAFGQSLLSSEFSDFCWEIRSVNHRYLDISVRLPEELRSLEAAVRERISAQINRGKVDISLKITNASGGIGKLIVNQTLLQQISDAIDQVQSVRIDAGRCDPIALLQWPGMLSMQTAVDDEVNRMVLDLFELALKDFLKTRAREGEQIASMLNDRAVQLSQIVAKLRKHRPTVLQRQREKLSNRLAQLDIEHEVNRLEQELVYAAQRLDIDEELDRLDAHLSELANVLERKEAVGRRLDFLMQEFNREANTVSSKSSDSDTTAVSIDMKVLIEQMREQVQNVE